MPIQDRSSSGEVHLDRSLAKYGRHGGFCDVVNGTTPYLYPMTYGVPRADVHRLVASHIQVRPSILDEVARATAGSVTPGAYVVGVHYRGTDSTRRPGLMTDNQTRRVSYQAYAEEVRRALDDAAASAYHVFVASDEIECLEFMQRTFGDRVIFSDELAAGACQRPADPPRSNAAGVELPQGRVGARGLPAAGRDRLSGERPVEPVRRVARLQPAAAVLVLSPIELRALRAFQNPRRPLVAQAFAQATSLRGTR